MTPATDWVPGKHGKALEFADASTQYVELDGTIEFATSDPLTVVMWVTAVGGFYPIAIGQTANNYDALLRMGNVDGNDYDTIGCRIANGSTTVISAAGMSSGVWTHLVLTRDTSSNWRGYVNGVDKTSGTPNRGGTFSVKSLAGGYDAGTPGRTWDGKMAHVAIYDRALSPQEVKTLYQDPWCLFRKYYSVPPSHLLFQHRYGVY
jgi:hypothetical protein